MHWAERIADEIIARNPNKKEYVCAAGISPSGSVHIGNFRDIATSYFVTKALRIRGKNARLLFSWDEFDRLRKVPIDVTKINSAMEKYIGYPYVDVPNPFNDSAVSYAEHFEREFESSLVRFGIDVDFRYQAQMYRSGAYSDGVILAMQKRKEIFDILDKHRTQDATSGERDAYYPLSIYCGNCKKDTTKVDNLSEDGKIAQYHCKCGCMGTIDFTRDHHYKLAWKVDWPMRWQYESVDFEPGGKDHASEHGSFTTSQEIAREIFGFEPPLFQEYGFIGIKGQTAKMSGSSGLNLTPNTLLNLYEPEIILWLYAKSEPTKEFDFFFDDGILRQYSEFDRMVSSVVNGTADEHTKDILRYSNVGDKPILQGVDMRTLVQLGSVVDFNIPLLETVFVAMRTSHTREQITVRMPKAKYWLEHCAPEQAYKLRTTRNVEVYKFLNYNERKEIDELFKILSEGDYTLEELNKRIYAIPKTVNSDITDEKAIQKLQKAFFKNVYKLLLDREQGPRLYLFLSAVEKQKYLSLLNFLSL